MTQVNQEASQLASQLTAYVTNKNDELIRARFVLLEHSVACEVVYIWLQAQQQHALSKALIEQVIHAVKTLPPGKKIQLPNGQLLQSYKNVVKFCKNV